MDNTTITRGCESFSGGRHVAAKPTEPLASSSSFSGSSINLPATPPNSGSFDSRVIVSNSETGWRPLAADLADYLHAPAGQQNSTRCAYDDRGGDWGMARWKSRPHRWWERDQEMRRQQLRDMEAKQAAFAMLGREDDIRRPGMCKTHMRPTNEALRIAQERDYLAEWMRKVENAIAYHGAQRKHYSDILRHTLQYTPYDRMRIERAGIQRDLHHDDFINASRELAFAKVEYEDIEKAEKRGRTMTVRRDLCKPREVSTPVNEPSSRNRAAGVSTPDVPVTDRDDDSVTEPDVLEAACVVS